MAKICVFTRDVRLRRMLTLLLEDAGHTVGEVMPTLLITDSETPPPALAGIRRLLIGEGGLTRPFSHAALLSAVAERLSDTPAPALTPTESRLLAALREASPAPVSREALSLTAFGTSEDDGRLNLYICYLRKKIEADGRKRIFACRGKGYYYQC